MTFVTIPEERFLTSLQKTRLTLLMDDAGFSGIDITMKQPDTDKEFQLPAIVMKRVVGENRNLARNSGYYEEIKYTDTVDILYGYRITAMYQFDVYATNISELNLIVTKLQNKLRNPAGGDVFASFGGAVQSKIRLKDFVSPTSSSGTNTDLYIRFRYPNDIDSAELPPMDKELHQFSLSVNFWIDYLKPYEAPMLKKVAQTMKLGTYEETEIIEL